MPESSSSEGSFRGLFSLPERSLPISLCVFDFLHFWCSLLPASLRFPIERDSRPDSCASRSLSAASVPGCRSKTQYRADSSVLMSPVCTPLFLIGSLYVHSRSRETQEKHCGWMPSHFSRALEKVSRVQLQMVR